MEKDINYSLLIKNSFENDYNFEDFGINLAQEKDGKVVIDKLNWKGQAKKMECKWVYNK